MTNKIPMQFCFKCGKLTDETDGDHGIGCLSCYKKTANSLTKEQYNEKWPSAINAFNLLNKSTQNEV